MPKDNENADKTAENSAKKPTKKSIPTNLAILKQKCKEQLKVFYPMRYLVERANYYTPKEAFEAIYARALQMDDNHKRWFRKHRRQMQEFKGEPANFYECALAKAAAVIATGDAVCTIRKDIMFQSDLDRIALGDLTIPQVVYDLQAAEELATTMLPWQNTPSQS